jgi:acyl-CoA thioester hydrolase
MPQVRIRFDYEIYNQNNELLNTGYAQLAFVNMKHNRPCKAPQMVLDNIEKFFK